MISSRMKMAPPPIPTVSHPNHIEKLITHYLQSY